MTILMEEETEVSFDFDHEALAREIISVACDAENCPYEAEVNLTLVDLDTIHQINKEYRQIDRPTDVLSFPMQSYDTPADFSHAEDCVEENFNPDSGELLLGDIILCIDKVKEQVVFLGGKGSGLSVNGDFTAGNVYFKSLEPDYLHLLFGC